MQAFEINEKFNLIKGSLRVADFDAAPESWSQMLSIDYLKGNNNKSKIYAIDLQT